MTTIKNRWVAVTYRFGLDTEKIVSWAVPIGIAVVIVVGMVLWWNRKLGAQIAERKKAEAELSRKEKQLRLAFDNMSDGLFIIDPDMRFALFNERYQKPFAQAQTLPTGPNGNSDDVQLVDNQPESGNANNLR